MPVRDLDVFINCPFDSEYRPIFDAIVFTVVRSGYRARCALEEDDSGENRLGKIMAIIDECKFGIHDISRTEVRGNPPVPRFNMPLELGLFLGAKKFGPKPQRDKRCIIYDTVQFRYQSFISDISGHDIHYHNGRTADLIRDLANWLRRQPGGEQVGGGDAFVEEYEKFQSFQQQFCERQKLKEEELGFPDIVEIVAAFVSSLKVAPAPDPAVGGVHQQRAGTHAHVG